MKRKLRPYQKETFSYSRIQHPALFLEMRLGKTLICIRRIKTYKHNKRILVVAPSSALGSWVTELKNEGYSSVALLLGSKNRRRDMLHAEYQWNLLNKEGYLAIPEIADIKWDVVILDESYFIKNPKAKVTNFFLRSFRQVQHRWILTGLPNPEGELDYFCQLKFLNENIFTEKNYWDYRTRNFRPYGFEFKMKPDSKYELACKLRRYCYSLKRKDVNMDREKIYETRTIYLPPNIQKAYSQLEQNFIFEYGRTAKRTKYAVAKFHWLRQITSGIIDDKWVWKGKVDVLNELLTSELKNEPVVLWCNYKKEMAYVYYALTKKKIKAVVVNGDVNKTKRYDIFSQFQKKKFRVLICEVHCALYGADFSSADTAIYYSNPLGYQERAQSEDRILSLKKKSPLLYIDLVVNNTVDEDVIEDNKSKEGSVNVMHRMVNRMKGRK